MHKQLLLPVAAFLLATSVFCTSVQADPLAEGKTAFKNKKYQSALELLEPLAKYGNNEASFYVARCLYYGWGIAQDKPAAIRLWSSASEHGYAPAQNTMALFYHAGDDVTQDEEKAARLYRQAADQDYATAQLNLGVMYEMGWGVKRDLAEAAKWYLKAANQGHTAAMNYLAMMYLWGVGVSRDHARATEWFRKAAEAGDASAQEAMEERTADPVEKFKWASLAIEQERKYGEDAFTNMRTIYPEDYLTMLLNQMTPGQRVKAQSTLADWKAATHPASVSLEIPYLTPIYAIP